MTAGQNSTSPMADGARTGKAGFPTPQPKAAVYFTKSANSGGGGGPNSFTMTNVQVNPGAGTIECMVRWGGYVGTGGLTAQFKFIGDHFEFLPATGSPTKKGVFCTDSSVPNIGQLYVTNTEFGFDAAGGGDTFAFDPATTFSNMSLTNSFFGSDSTTLVFKPGGNFAQVNWITNSYLGGNFHATGDVSRYLSMANNVTNSATIDGVWGRFSSSNDNFAALNDTAASGHIAIGNLITQAWTPVVQFGGVNSTRMTWTTKIGTMRSELAGGGFHRDFQYHRHGGVATEALRPERMTITGLPYTCSGNFFANPPVAQTGFAAGVGTATLLLSPASPAYVRVFKASSTGVATVTNPDITNTMSIYGTVTCGSAA